MRKLAWNDDLSKIRISCEIISTVRVLCLTLHRNEGNYLSHTQGKRHQTNLETSSTRGQRGPLAIKPVASSTVKRKKTIKIGRPGYINREIQRPVNVDCCSKLAIRRPGGSSTRTSIHVRVRAARLDGDINTFCLRLNPMKRLHLRFQIKRLIKARQVFTSGMHNFCLVYVTFAATPTYKYGYLRKQ